MQNMGRVSAEGMAHTDEVILDIMCQSQKSAERSCL